jgi:hypothetical protein
MQIKWLERARRVQQVAYAAGAWPRGARARSPSHSANGGGRIRDSDGAGCWSKFTPPPPRSKQWSENFFRLSCAKQKWERGLQCAKVWDWIARSLRFWLHARVEVFMFLLNRGFVFVAADDDERQVWLPTELFHKSGSTGLFCSCYKKGILTKKERKSYVTMV